MFSIKAEVLFLPCSSSGDWFKKIDMLVEENLNRNKSSITLKCLSIGTPKTINFPFVPNGKLMVFRYPNT